MWAKGLYQPGKGARRSWRVQAARPINYMRSAPTPCYGIKRTIREQCKWPAQFDALTEKRQTTLKAVWMAYVDQAAQDATKLKRKCTDHTKKGTVAEAQTLYFYPVVMLSGCAYQVTLMPRDSRKTYSGTLEAQARAAP